jgi:hypothetical protein
MGLDIKLATTPVGSFPHEDVDAACDLILKNFPEIPAWPQLPKITLNEQMEIQYSEGMPCRVIDTAKGRMFFDTSGDITDELERFYENILMENLDYFAISEDFGHGLHAMASRLSQGRPDKMQYFKVQVTGPVSFALTIVDENKRAIYYNDIFRDVIVKGIAMKARWQLREFAPLWNKLICVIDEPILSAFGSSTYVSVHRDDVVAHIHEVVAAIHKEGALAGIHCCGNTEWTIPIDAGIDILNFDAFGYGDSILLYPAPIKELLDSGGTLAWGIVPTSEDVDTLTADSLADRFEELASKLASKGIDRDLILENSMITSGCGTGSVPIDRAERIAERTKQVSDILRERHC